MELVKLLIVSVKKSRAEIPQYRIKFGDIIVELHKINKKATAGDSASEAKDFIVSARIKLKKYPTTDSKGQIVVTKKDTTQLESAIENVVNLLSVSKKIAKTISAPIPSIAFNPENEDERKWLEKSPGIRTNNQKRMRFSTAIEIDFEFCLKNLTDRHDGVSLIAEAISSSSDTAKFHDFIRLFERAFGLSSKKLTEPLSGFLSGTELKYQKSEIEKWISTRHLSTHADLKESFLLGSDVAPFIQRIEQAAYDVLFNKRQWRSKSIERRDLYRIEFGTNKPHNVLITKGSAGYLLAEILDETCSYSIRFDSVLKVLPHQWWSKNTSGNIFERPFGTVVERPK